MTFVACPVHTCPVWTGTSYTQAISGQPGAILPITSRWIIKMIVKLLTTKTKSIHYKMSYYCINGEMTGGICVRGHNILFIANLLTRLALSALHSFSSELTRRHFSLWQSQLCAACIILCYSAWKCYTLLFLQKWTEMSTRAYSTSRGLTPLNELPRPVRDTLMLRILFLGLLSASGITVCTNDYQGFCQS